MCLLLMMVVVALEVAVMLCGGELVRDQESGEGETLGVVEAGLGLGICLLFLPFFFPPSASHLPPPNLEIWRARLFFFF